MKQTMIVTSSEALEWMRFANALPDRHSAYATQVALLIAEGEIPLGFHRKVSAAYRAWLTFGTIPQDRSIY